jgi:hypothetical protein
LDKQDLAIVIALVGIVLSVVIGVAAVILAALAL